MAVFAQQWRATIFPLAKKRRSISGFSLLEMFCVLVILGILAVLSSSQIKGTGRARKTAVCQKNLQTIFMALSIYGSDNKGVYPFVSNAQTAEVPLSLLVPRSTTVTEPFICPASDDKRLPEGEPFVQRRISYAFYMGRRTNALATEVVLSDRQVDTSPKRKGALLFSRNGKPPGNNHGDLGGNLLLCDGSAQDVDTNAPIDLLFPPTISLLNPRP